MAKHKKVHHSLADAKPKVDPFYAKAHQTLLSKLLRRYKMLHGKPADDHIYTLVDDLTNAQMEAIVDYVEQYLAGVEQPLLTLQNSQGQNVEVNKLFLEPTKITQELIFDEPFPTVTIEKPEVDKGPAKTRLIDLLMTTDLLDSNISNYTNFPKNDLMDVDGLINKLMGKEVKIKIDPAKDMWWTPKGQPKMLASKMSTMHLFYALRMLYNKCVPSEYRIGNTPMEKNQKTIATADDKKAIQILFNLLAERDDIDETCMEPLVYMARVVREKL